MQTLGVPPSPWEYPPSLSWVQKETDLFFNVQDLQLTSFMSSEICTLFYLLTLKTIVSISLGMAKETVNLEARDYSLRRILPS